MSRITNLLINIGSDESEHTVPPREADVSGRWAAVRSVSAGIHAADGSARFQGWPEIVWRQEGIQQEHICVTVAPVSALTVEEEP